ncbi:MAG: hypothetical protein P8N55_07495 [Flavobacteriaceae bacterium]|nr:hypothetical protein [Lacinutrix sp.]MDG1251930.1 hypothetical protein [Flavobacteriaceae bacterium]MDG1715409.1 hypothetical protein [Lacinutrix sp.]MDG2236085.1 hypothetical protein [Flavobacteriaceae bacterium]|tara:strand:- start:1289 stop:1939 length:651 start_codon:yes stop_codon:yes gene_type:complete
MKLGIQVVLWIASIFFAYKIYDSISGPITFNQTKIKRYSKVINVMKDIRTAQIAHKDVKGVYANNFDSLIKFIDEGIFTLLEKRDSSYLEYDRTYRIDMLREVIVTDTLGFVAVKDSLFQTSDRYKKMSNIPIEGLQDSVFKITSSIINKNGYKVPVFEVKVSKNTLLFDQDQDLVKQENETVSVDGVNGPEIILGSLTNVSTNGNWPTIFDAKQE